MATYTELANRVLDWSNRDSSVLPYNRIKSFLEFAADEAYRVLRIPSLEITRAYAAIDSDGVGKNTLDVPTDMIELIQLRRKDPNSPTGYIVYANKVDIRSFNNEFLVCYDRETPYYFSREGGNYLVYPELREGDEFEIFYYRRLPDVDARYTAIQANFNNLYYSTTTDGLMTEVEDREGTDTFTVDPDLEAKVNNLSEITLLDGSGNMQTGYYLGYLGSHWLRDYNQKILLFGALAEAFAYLQEPEQAQIYMSKFDEDIAKLNAEETQRMYYGGNLQVRYTGFLI